MTAPLFGAPDPAPLAWAIAYRYARMIRQFDAAHGPYGAGAVELARLIATSTHGVRALDAVSAVDRLERREIDRRDQLARRLKGAPWTPPTYLLAARGCRSAGSSKWREFLGEQFARRLP